MKQQFIAAMQSLADEETIFPANSEFWEKIFNEIDSGKLNNIQREWDLVYRTIAFLNRTHYVVAKDSALEPYPGRKPVENLEVAISRMLLTAIEYRLQQKSVAVICDSHEEKRRFQQKYENLLLKIGSQELEEYKDVNILDAKGGIDFLVYQDSLKFDWQQMRIQGSYCTCLVSPFLIRNRFSAQFHAYNRFMHWQALSPFVMKAMWWEHNPRISLARLNQTDLPKNGGEV